MPQLQLRSTLPKERFRSSEDLFARAKEAPFGGVLEIGIDKERWELEFYFSEYQEVYHAEKET